jgi:hypothetical protein
VLLDGNFTVSQTLPKSFVDAQRNGLHDAIVTSPAGSAQAPTRTPRKLLSFYGINISRWERQEQTWDAVNVEARIDYAAGRSASNGC